MGPESREQTPGFYLRCLCVWLFGVVLSGGVNAADWERQARLNLQAIYTDNIERSATGETGELVGVVRPGLSASASGARLRFGADYALTHSFHADDSDRDRTYHQLDGFAELELVEDHLFFDLDAAASQQLIDAQAAAGVDLVAGNTGNIATAWRLSGGPRWRQRLGGYGLAQAAYTYSVVDYSDGLNGSTGGVFTASLDSGARTYPVFWNLSYLNESLDYEQGADRDRSREHGEVTLGTRVTASTYVSGTYGFDRRDLLDTNGRSAPDNDFWRLTAGWNPSSKTDLSVYHQERDFKSAAIAADAESSFWGANARWSPNPRWSLNAGYGNDFYGDTYNLGIFHRLRRVSWSLEHTEELTNARAVLLDDALIGFLICPIGALDLTSCRFPAPGEVPAPGSGEELVGIVGTVPSLVEDDFVQRSTRFSWAYRRAKSTWTLGLFQIDREAFAADDLGRDRGASLGWWWRVGQRSTLELGANHVKKQFPVSPTLEERRYRMGWRRTSGRGVDWSLLGERIEGERVGGAEFTEHRVTASVTVRTR